MNVTDRTHLYDVAVVGGGMAGLCAALAAAREGARTVLVHNRPVLGGNASTEIGVPSCGAGYYSPSANETGIILELLLEERAFSANKVDYASVGAHWDLVLFDAVKREPNLDLLLNTHVTTVDAVDGRRVSCVTGVQQGTERVWEIRARVFIDCTGDGTVGAAAGVPWRVGPESRSEYGESLAPERAEKWVLGSSLLFRARDAGRPVPFAPPAWAARYPDESGLEHREHAKLSCGYWWMEVGFPYDTIRQNEQVRDELLRHVYGVWDHIKNHCVHRDRAASWVLDWVGTVPGKRESRRFIGAHIVTQQEIQARVLYPDRIAYGGWLIDDHTRGGVLEPTRRPAFDDGYSKESCYVAPYSVPLSSLWAPEVQNLLFAGRLMSASRVAFNSLRVQSTLAVGGQAAGTAAAHAARQGVMPGEFTPADVAAVQQALLRQDCFIPGVRNEDPADLARGARLTASSAAVLSVAAGRDGLPLDRPLAQTLPLTHWPELVRAYLRNEGAEARWVRVSLLPAQDIWDLEALRNSRPAATTALLVPAGYEGPVEARLDGAASGPGAVSGPGRPGLYWLRLEPEPDPDPNPNPNPRAGGPGLPGVTWLFQEAPLPGCVAARCDGERWAFAPEPRSDWRPFAAEASPTSCPYGPQNVVSGVSRPEAWPNVWRSGPGLPQWIRLDLSSPAQIRTVQVAWGLNLSRSYFDMEPLFRAPEVARDYRIDVELSDGTVRPWVAVVGNYQRLRLHPRPDNLPHSGDGGTVRAILITIAATNGANWAEVAEVRAYL